MPCSEPAGKCDVVGIGRPTITTPDAARLVLEGRAETLTAHQVRYGMRTLLGRVADLQVLDGLLDISWHTDQIHRLGNGLHPDPNRGSLPTTIAMVRRDGRTSFRAKLGGS
ncbi:UNVERIFIED_CONTAM: hypothetical protein RKD50_001034 [Streptomyces canus]